MSCLQLRAAESKLANYVERLERADAETLATNERLRLQCEQTTTMRVELQQLCDELKHAQEHSTRARKSADVESGALTTRVRELEEALDASRARAVDLRSVERRLASAEATLVERNNRIHELDAECAMLRAEAEREADAQRRLREQLVASRARLADLLCRLRSIWAMCRAKTVNVDDGETTTTTTSSAEPIDDDTLLNTIDQLLYRAFDECKAEREALRIQRQLQIEEINTLSRNLHSLR